MSPFALLHLVVLALFCFGLRTERNPAPRFPRPAPGRISGASSRSGSRLLLPPGREGVILAFYQPREPGRGV